MAVASLAVAVLGVLPAPSIVGDDPHEPDAVLLVLPGIAQALPAGGLVTEFWPTKAGGQLTSVYHAAHTLQPWPGFGVMCLFTASVYAIAWTLLDRRDP